MAANWRKQQEERERLQKIKEEEERKKKEEKVSRSPNLIVIRDAFFKGCITLLKEGVSNTFCMLAR